MQAILDGDGAMVRESAEPEQPLTGGMVNTVVRVGDTVRRTAGPWTPAVHAVLEHLERVGFDRAPRALGLDDQGREVLSFLPGTPADRPWPEVLRTGDGLRQLAEMVADLAVALASFEAPPDAVWRSGGVPRDGRRVLRHGDLGPWNTLWDGDRLVGLIDWDFLEPAPELWDFAQLAWFAVPLRPEPKGWRTCGFAEEPDHLARLELIADHAGVSAADLAATLLDLQACDRDRMLTWGRAGIHPYDSFLERGLVAEIEAESRWLRDQLRLA
ncbi:phosphotransferase [Occultella gossypii]|uniref:Aminoglycoside phosphotransferase family protein n=1 Tax=Occultella gossypii TaxID=2800820 RepID=A0ABS7S4Q4_9MICO|nr:aminoglycoside phosphotransferase family protein [Occultella gossypii]MBZ2195331.1 aminoglycoside phosphotransferase family protein [Occultella gossypii]